MATKKPKGSPPTTTVEVEPNETEATGATPTAEDTEEVDTAVGEPTTPTKKVEVSTHSMLVSGLIGNLELGVVYEFTHTHRLVATADSTTSGAVKITLPPNCKWNPKVAEALWEYEMDEDKTADPTTVDTLVDGWSAILITDVTEYEAEESEEEQDSDESETITDEE